MKRLILVRHGQSEHHVQNITGGWTDLPLTHLGEEQAYCTARILKNSLCNAKLYCSDLIRAQRTAEILGSQMSLTPISFEALRELNNGLAKDLTNEQAKRIRLPKPQKPDIDWIPYSQAESWRMMYLRISNFMDSIKHIQEDIVIVSHANAIIAIIHWWLELKQDEDIARIMFDTDPCGITYLTEDTDGCKVIHKLNDVSHLNICNSQLNN